MPHVSAINTYKINIHQRNKEMIYNKSITSTVYIVNNGKVLLHKLEWYNLSRVDKHPKF